MVPKWNLEEPSLTFSQVDVCPLRTTLCYLLLKKLDKMFNRLPHMQFLDNLN